MKKDQCSAGPKQRKAKPGEVYAFYVELSGKYGACQVLAVDGKSICYVLLDYLEEVPPEEDILERLKPYHRESFRHHHQVVKTGIENTPVPRDYLYIGRCELKSDPAWDSYSWKWPSGEDYYYEERWKSFDENARLAYKKYINSGDFVSVHGRMFRKNAGGLRDELYQCLTEKDTLEEFPCITYAEVQGYSGRLGRLMSTAPLLRTLRLRKAGVEVLDLGKTCLEDLELDMGGIGKLVLPENTRSLKLYGEIRPDLQIDDSLCGGKVNLELSLRRALPRRYGLSKVQVRRLRLTDIRELDMEQVAEQFPETEYLNMSGSPGTVTRMRAVGKLSGLRHFYGKDLFGYGAEDMEALESLRELRELDLDSIPKGVGLYLKKRWRGKLERLSVAHLREDSWLRDNLENPLRHWDGSEFIPGAAYRSAVKCYKDTRKRLSEAADRGETEEREDIFAAMQKLYEECILHGECGQADERAAPFTLSQIWDIMDEVREGW